MEIINADFPYILTAHAQVVISAREIQLEWIKRALETPKKTEADKYDVTLLHALIPIIEKEDRILRVVYNKEVSPWRIVTAYFDRTIRGKI